MSPAFFRTRLAVVIVAALGLVAAIGACSSDSDSDGGGAYEDGISRSDGSPAPGEESAAVALEDDRTVIDVRTPEEFAEGHVADAELIDIQADGFDDRIAELDPEGTYVVYCRSGNRSAAATEQMREAGLDVLDGGGLDDMTAAGWPREG